MASVLLHGVAIAGAVSLTMATPSDAKPDVRETHDIVYTPIDPTPPRVEPTPTLRSPQPTLPNTQWTIVVPKDMPPMLPPIDLSGPPIPPDAIPRLVGSGEESPFHPGPKVATTPKTVVNFDAVDRVPSLLGNARAPRYPDALRQSNIDGKVSIRFVVDTLGRAEMDGVEIVETSHPLFAEAVKNALAFYRFSAGEVGGRKVRTMVQIPFTFSLTK